MLGVLLCTEHADFYKRDDWTIEDGKYEQCRSAQGPVIGFIRQKKTDLLEPPHSLNASDWLELPESQKSPDLPRILSLWSSLGYYLFKVVCWWGCFALLWILPSGVVERYPFSLFPVKMIIDNKNLEIGKWRVSCIDKCFLFRLFARSAWRETWAGLLNKYIYIVQYIYVFVCVYVYM